MEMTLAEQFLLAAHHNEKSRFILPNNQTTLGMFGAMFIDLLEAGDIKIVDEKVICTPMNSSASVHPKLYQILDKSKKNLKIKRWMQRLNYKANSLKKEVLESLRAKKEIGIEQKKFLGLIPYKQTHVVNRMQHRMQAVHLKNILLLKKDATPVEQKLLSLLIGSQILPYFGKDRHERKKIRKKMKDFNASDSIGADVSQAVEEMQAVIIATMAAATAVNVSTSH